MRSETRHCDGGTGARYFERAAARLGIHIEREQPCAEARPRDLGDTRPEFEFVLGEVDVSDGKNLTNHATVL